MNLGCASQNKNISLTFCDVDKAWMLSIGGVLAG
jgi:hypothetical protein